MMGAISHTQRFNIHIHTEIIWTQISNTKKKTKRRLPSFGQALSGIYRETSTLAQLKRRPQIHYYCNSVNNNRACGTMLSSGHPAAYNTDRLSPRQRCPLQWYSQPIVCPVCGQNLAFLVYTVMWTECCFVVIYSIVVCVQDNKGHHVIHSPHTDDTRQNAAAAAESAAAASVDRWL